MNALLPGSSLSQPPLASRPDVVPAAPVVPVSSKPALIGLTLEALREVARALGSPAFRGDQLHHWLYVRCERDLERMSNLSKGFRQVLAQQYQVGQLQVASRQQSADGTIKYLFRLADGEVIETVLMYFEERQTYAICLSTQVGCAMNCAFCATGKIGLKRHLTTAEIVEQYVYVQHDSGKDIRNVVFMGQGEPLHNYDHTVAAIRLLNHSAEVGMRRMTVSTSGKVPDIDRLAAEGLPITLAISLHAPDDETRQRIMPINKRWPLAQLMPALQRYVEKTNRRLTVEYILIDGVNDTPEHAERLVQRLKGLKANVNLIPYNPINANLPNVPDFKRPSRARIEAFKERVARSGKKVTVRLERGVDIDAACGQLANRVMTDGPAV